ncbi:MAG: fucose isomerase [Bacteroidales bacterium]|nr:fucose isomerase [Bacteroidales bacterium]MBR6929646.1 fucose isomerase [Bacteroidales bacterium]
MKIIILRSSFQTDDFVRTEYVELLQRLENECCAEIHIIGDESVETHGRASLQTLPDAVMIATGGVENLFKRIWEAIDVEMMCSPLGHKSVTMIADGRNNSLAAALEILTYLGNNGMEGRIVHGTNDEIVSAIIETHGRASLRGRIGLFGQPSDWLIASSVDCDFLLQHYGIETVDIDLQRLIEGIKAIPQDEAAKVAQTMVKRAKAVKEPTNADMLEAAKAYLAIKRICQEERLDALTIRCFDIVKACGTTSCLALALLNDEGIVAGCEGDMQTLMSMFLAKRICGETAFMANPSQLTDKSSMLAHCTIPLSMCDETIVRSHFESGIGVAVQGLLPLTDYTLFKWGGPQLDRYFVAEAQAVETPYSDHFCRTQITLSVNLKPYLLQHSIGNHHVIICGRHADEIRQFMQANGAQNV